MNNRSELSALAKLNGNWQSVIESDAGGMTEMTDRKNGRLSLGLKKRYDRSVPGESGAMIRRSEIRAFVKRVVQEFNPERVILFGSCARGNPTADSDVDLLVVMNCRKAPIDQAVDIRWRIPRKFPMDLLVRRPAEIRRRLAHNDSFIGTIMREGHVLYERKNQ